MKYWTVDKETREVTGPGDTDKWNMPRNVLLVEPLPKKEGFAVVAKADLSGSEYIEDNRGTTVFDELDCTKSVAVTELGPIKEGFTKELPATKYDEWQNGAWVTNLSKKYIADYAQVDTTREALYRAQTDPLENEARRLERSGATVQELQVYYDRIDELVVKIKADNPWPVNPEA